jgi:hypothetical protein
VGIGAAAGVPDGSAMGGMWGYGADPHIGAAVGPGMESGDATEGWVLQNGHQGQGQLYATQWRGGECLFVFLLSTPKPKANAARLAWYATAVPSSAEDVLTWYRCRYPGVPLRIPPTAPSPI